MSLKHIIIILINTIALLGYSQKQQADYYYQGENGETVYRVDSLAHRNMYMLSNYYIDPGHVQVKHGYSMSELRALPKDNSGYISAPIIKN